MRDSTHSRVFWALVAAFFLMILYGWGLARFESRVRKARTDVEVRARALEVEGKMRPMDEVLRMLGINGDAKR